MKKPKLIRGTNSAWVEAPFDEAKGILNEDDYRIISLEEMALLRMQKGKDANVSKYGNWTREGFLYVPKKGVYLVKHSPILDCSIMATNAHRDGKEFYINNEQVEEALEDSVLVPYDLNFLYLTDFGDEEITAFAFGDQAKAYGELLKDAGITEMPIWLVDSDYVNKQSKPFVRQLWFSSLDCSSDLFGNYVDLYYCIRVLGVRKDAEGIEKILEKPKEKEVFKNPFDVYIPKEGEK